MSVTFTVEQAGNEDTIIPEYIRFNLGIADVTYNTTGGKIVVEFDFSDYASPVLILNVPAGALIINTVVEIDTAFDSGSLTIGTQAAQGILMAVADRSNSVGKYEVHNYLLNDTAQDYKAFFTGTPTQGTGKFIIYYM